MDEPATGVDLCASADLLDGGLAVPFEVHYLGRDEPAFAVRYGGQVYAYLNRCTHVPMEMDVQPNQFFDTSGHYLICATHGALYDPRNGQCRLGRCRGALVTVPVSEHAGRVRWHTRAPFSLPQAHA